MFFYKDGFSIKLPTKVDMPLNKEPDQTTNQTFLVKSQDFKRWFSGQSAPIHKGKLMWYTILIPVSLDKMLGYLDRRI